MTDLNDIAAAAEALRRGELVAFPTETVYGLGADATNDQAVARVYAVKGRPSFNPLIVHVADAETAFELGQFPEAARRLASAFWPGPLSIVVERAPSCPVSLLASAGLTSIAIRVPAHPVALTLLKATGRPVVAPSANLSGRVSPPTAEHVRQHLGQRVALVVDGGRCAIGLESTVVSFLEEPPKLLRPGGLPRAEVESAIGPVGVESHSARPHAPGQLASHYATRAKIRIDAKAPRCGEAYLGFGHHDSGSHNLSRQGDVVEAAANLFRLLHQLDATGVAKIAVAPIPHTGLGEAINDRLRRAAAPRNRS